MTSCNHTTLELLPRTKSKLRCRHCHLTLNIDELGDGYCPECFDIDGRKRYEFEEIAPADREVARYRCSECGILINSE